MEKSHLEDSEGDGRIKLSRLWGWVVDRIGSGLSSMEGFGTSGAEPFGSIIWVLIPIEMCFYHGL